MLGINLASWNGCFLSCRYGVGGWLPHLRLFFLIIIVKQQTKKRTLKKIHSLALHSFFNELSFLI